MREELHEYLLALALTAVLIWYTYVSVPHTSARAVSRQPPDAEERGAGAGPPPAGESEADARADEDLEWPEFIYP